jgi:radical SAM-linked protein
MGSDQPQTALPVSPAAKPRVCDKVRIRFRKGGDLRLVSHRDLMKCFERALRRAELPVHATQGFHPMPRMVFALSLGLGIVGLSEVLELEFDEPVAAADVHARLAKQLPKGLDILSVRRVPVSASAQVRRAGYGVQIPAEHSASLPDRIAALLAAPECWFERTRPEQRRVNLRPYLSEIRRSDQRLEIVLWVTPTGTARPAEILEAIGLGDLVESGIVLERFFLEIHDETHDPGPVPEAQPAPASVPRPREHAPAPERPTPLVSGPMNFDS